MNSLVALMYWSFELTGYMGPFQIQKTKKIRILDELQIAQPPFFSVVGLVVIVPTANGV
jgi:hypothetical protein